MITIVYDAVNGRPIADGLCRKVAMNLALEVDNDITETFSTENVLQAIRLEIIHDRLPVDKVRFMFEGKVLEHNKYGNITNWPKGYCQETLNLLRELCLDALNKRKNEKSDER